MKQRLSTALLLSLAFLIPSCQNSPTNPSMASAKITSIRVTSPSGTEFLVGETASFTAIAVMSDGSLKTIREGEGTWSSSDPSVARVDRGGQVIVVGPGGAAIIMAYSGQTGSRSISVRGDVPDYQGSWTGTYGIVGCGGWGDFETNGFCGTITGSGYPMDLILTQDFRDIRGTVNLGGFSGTVAGEIEADAKLRLWSVVPASPYRIDVEIEFQLSDPGRMSGRMILTYTATGLEGEGILNCSNNTLNRTSAAADR